MNLNTVNTIHFVGIKGVAMTALAIIAKEMGKKITGSDIEEKFPTDEMLKKFDITYENNFSPRHITSNIDLVIYTGAHQGSYNVEVKEAVKKGIPILSHGEALGLLMQGKRGISVAGSHGKTTASAMVAHVLSEAGYDTSFAIGCGEILSLKTPAHFGKGEYFVAEADEYITDPQADKTPRFLWQNPEVLLITNIDFDHPDAYQNISEIQAAFIKFTQKVTDNGFVVCNLDNLETKQILPRIKKDIITYGTTDKADFILKNVEFKNSQTQFTISNHTQTLGNFTLKIPGLHNALNATCVVAGLVSIGISVDKIKLGLSTFVGTKRRFELVGNKNGKLFYDDYAHHPAEIAATLSAVKKWFPKKRLIAIFQPHTYSRTKILLKQFSKCFTNANEVLITEIYASAREKPVSDISGKLLCQEIQKYQKGVYYAPRLVDVIKYLKTKTASGDLIISMGAGDIFSWIEQIYKAL